MRKLADFAFMLRDYKLAQSTYDILRGDFNNDKAWKYYAGASEMAALSMLLNSQGLSVKTRMENLDQLLEAASYSYITRCIAPYYALRTLAIAPELLKAHGSSAADDSARWASRILEAGLVGPIGHALFTERISACYAARKGVGSMNLGLRRRKSALWAMLAADEWAKMGKYSQAERALREASELYGIEESGSKTLAFDGMQMLVDALSKAVAANRELSQGYDETPEVQPDEEVVDEVSEEFVSRPQRKSLLGVEPSPAFAGLDATPLTPTRVVDSEPVNTDDSFEQTDVRQEG